MGFFTWHYSWGVRFYLHKYKSSLVSIVHYFSLPLLAKSLFSPWKRLMLKESGRGFNMAEFFNVLSFNLVSRVVGFFARLILLLTGSLILLFMTFFGFLGLFFWYLFPVMSYPIYTEYRRNPEVVTRHLMHHFRAQPARAMDFLLGENPGKFFLSHLGIEAETVRNAADKEKFTFKNPEEIKSFYQIIKELVENEVWDESFFVDNGLKKEDFLNAAFWWDRRAEKNSHVNMDPPNVKAGIGKELLVGYTPSLDKFGADLGDRDFSYKLVGRAEIVSRMDRALTGGSNVMLIGAPGVGKMTVVLEFAKRAAYGQLSPSMAYQRIVEVDLNAIASEAGDLNVKKRNISNILAEAAHAGNVILVFKDLHRYTNAAVEGVDFTDIFEKYLEKGFLKMISVSTKAEYERFLVPNSRLKRFFDVVEVTEPDVETAMKILIEVADDMELKNGLIVTVPTLRRIINGSNQYITDTPFPEKAIEILQSVFVYHKQHGSGNVIGFNEAEEVISERTGVPVAALTDDKRNQLMNLESIIHERLVGQEEAIDLIAKIIRSKSSGVVSNSRPIGSFLFLGPTGVGKTETAKVLAKVYFGSENSILRFDMAEYSGREGLERLIGSQYNNQPGVLTTAIKNKPASLLLLDEFEKAPPQIYNLFLRILDEGMITDAFGNQINCSNLFVIATSNAGAEYIRELVNTQNMQDLHKNVTNHVMEKGIFSPEFLNRFDGVVVYKPLTQNDLLKVTELLLMELAENVFNQKNISIRFSEDAVAKIAQEGYEPEFGARPLRRLIDLKIGDLVGQAVLQGQVVSGDRISIVPGQQEGEYRYIKN